ncbi:Replication factor A protein 1 [Erysiphe neolycopersici]|uniref:Replication protein A subunit n=1 Tax=Erysiphe neolycopersici TaxID=212602 RepID=A0A420I707_9PEZI|nr:Replication factor A protein 1 [Erysiphe neolycopersici]
MAEAVLSQISRGALSAIFNNPSSVATDFPLPVCQCVQIKTLTSNQEGAPERYRLVLSDVNNFVQSMLATQANHVMHEGKLKRGSIVRLRQFQPNSVKGKRILIILDLEVLENLGEFEKIGEPVAVPVIEDVKPIINSSISGSGFYGNKPSHPVEPKKELQQSLPSRTGPPISKSHSVIYPIESLSPYAHKWTIKARVTSKSDIRTWHKPNSEGKLFSVNLLDESGEIRATGFNEQCDLLYDVFQEGAVYYISSPCKVNLAKKQFSNIPNDYELMFERDTLVERAEDQENVPQVRYNFTTVSDLQNVEKDSTVDIIGVLKDAAEATQITSKTTQKPFDKRELTIVDDTGYSVRVTIWGKTALAFDANPESILALKGCKVSDFGGRSLSLLSSGSLTIDPDIAEAHKLRGWYDSQGRQEEFSSHTSMAGAGVLGGRSDVTKTIAQVREENLGMSENNDYFSTKATIVYIKQENPAYPACLSESCNKKLTDMGDGTWRCEKCDISHPRPEYRYILSLNVNDHTGQLWLSCFNDVGRMVMGMDANKLIDLRENDTQAMEKTFETANCKTFIFKIRAKMDNYQDQQRVRYQVIGALPLDFVQEAKKLAEVIKQYNLD